MTTVTTAKLADIPQLCALLDILFSQEADFQPDQVKQSTALHEIIARPEMGCILVLRDGNTISGMVNLLYTISTACGGKVAILEDMIVHPLQRNNGFGSQLLQAAIAHAEREGCLRITLLTDRSNDFAQRFYRRHGFSSSEMIPLRLSMERPRR